MKSNLKLFILSGNFEQNFDTNLYLKAYLSWKRVWSEVWQELGVKKDMISDQFSRQDHIYVIVDGETVAGVLLLKKYATQDPLLFEDSVFSYPVPENIKNTVRSLGNQFHIGSSISVSKEYRRSKVGHLLVACYVKSIFTSTDINYIYSTARNTVGADKYAKYFNATLLGTVDIDFGQEQKEPSSIFIFDKNCSIPEPLNTCFQDLWENRSDYQHIEERQTVSK